MAELASATGSHGKTRGRGAALLGVGDYLGEPAARAAQAVRRAGLRPALERSFGCEASASGTVVDQDPPAGSEVSRSTMVTLYVAAPAPDAAAQTRPQEPQAPPSEPHAEASAPATFEADRERQPLRAPTTAACEQPEQQASGELSGTVEPEPHAHRDLFIDPEPTGRLWRSVYPRRPLGTRVRSLMRRVSRHRFASVCVLAALAWVSVVTEGQKHTATTPVSVARPRAARPKEPARAGSRSPAGPRHQASARGAKRTLASPVRTSPAAPVRDKPRHAPVPVTAAPAVSPDTAGAHPPEQQQTEGGPFSP